MQKVIVTGGCGFIGSYFIDLLLSKNVAVLNIDSLTYAATPKNIEDPNYQFVQCDICSLEAKKIITNYDPDLIVNFAAETHVDNSIFNSAPFWETNIEGVENLLKNIPKKCKFIQISTDEVFGTYPFFDDVGFKEDQPHSPQNPYAISKSAAENLCEFYRKAYGNKIQIIRMTNNFGPKQNEEKFIPKVITSIKNGTAIPIYGNGLQQREWIYVKDAAREIYDSINLDFHSVNLKGSYMLSNMEVVSNISSLMESPHKINWVADRPNHDTKYCLNSFFVKPKRRSELTKALKETIISYVGN